MTFSNYLKSVRSKGKYTFTADDALSSLSISKNALNCAIYRLKKRGEIVTPASNLYVIVPPEYQAIGCIPAPDLIPILMKHWDLPYYACLLSAALYHGASHQKPQVFQVMTNKQLKTLHCGQVRVEFIYKKSLENLPTKKITVKTGYLIISTPELTIMDLFQYANHSGGLNHITTVLNELIENVSEVALIKLIDFSREKAWIQRLGYVLEQIETMNSEKQQRLIDLLQNKLVKPSTPIPLASELPIKGYPRDLRWMIIENTTIESDL